MDLYYIINDKEQVFLLHMWIFFKKVFFFKSGVFAKKSFLLSHVEFLQAVQFAGGFRSDGFEEEVSLSEKGLKVKWEARDIKYKYTMKYV